MARTVLDDTDQVDRNDEVARLAALDLLIKSKGSYKSQVTMALNALQIKLNTLDSQKKAGLVHRDNLKDTEVNCPRPGEFHRTLCSIHEEGQLFTHSSPTMHLEKAP